MLSFPAGIVTILANNPNPAKLVFHVKNTQRLTSILPNKQLVAMYVCHCLSIYYLSTYFLL